VRERKRERERERERERGREVHTIWLEETLYFHQTLNFSVSGVPFVV
jgi:hypothetical protein